MKKIICFIVAVCSSIMAIISFSGCEMTNDQMGIIANQAGMVAAVSWVGIDNPETDIKELVIVVVDGLEANLDKVSQGQSYAVALQPILNDIINSNVEAHLKPLTLMGGNALLTGIDLLLAMYPTVAENEQMTVEIIHQFFLGAKNGLSLKSDSKIMLAIKPGCQLRAKQLKSIAQK